MSQPIRVAFIGAVRRTTGHNFWTMAENYAGIVHVPPNFECKAFPSFDASGDFLAKSCGERRIVIFTDEAYDPVAAVAAARQAHAKVLVFTAAYPPGAPEVLPVDQTPASTSRKPLIFALDSVSVENIWRLLA